MESGSNSLQDLENEEVDEHVNLDEAQEDEENIMLDERGEIGERWEEDRKSPKVGMIFKSIKDAYDLYNEYSFDNGFGIAINHSRKKDDKPFEITIGCAKGGKAKVAQDFTAKRGKMSRKTNCKAKIIVRKHNDGLWQLDRLVLEHNHSCTPSKALLFRSHKNMSLVVKKQLENNDAPKVPPNMSFGILLERGGGYKNLPYTEGDCRNYVGKVRHLTLKKGDAQALVDYFLHKNEEDPGFFYVMDLDEDGRLRNVFWADSRSKAMYKHFNDVISFDTTYLTNKYDMPFSPFVGVNHHGSSILLGAGLLCDENTDTYVWLFKAWLACMGGVAPKAIITDQSKAIGNAVANVFPNSKHRLCIWHILKKVPEEFAGHANYHNIKRRFYDVVYDSLTVHKFEKEWGELLKDYNLYSNEWLKSLFEVRKIWVPAFVKNSFWAGMSSTQRSEGMDAYFDKYVTSTTSLQEFVINYEKALMRKFEKETIEDFDAGDKQPTLISILKFEEQLSQIYTLNIFRKFQREMQKCLNCTISLVRNDGEIKVYEVKEYLRDKMHTYEVSFNEEKIEVRCVCCLFEFQGIFCVHAIYVLKEEHIMEMPSRYICDRWRKDFKRNYHTYSFPNVILKSYKELYNNLYKHGFQCLLDIVEVGATSKEKHDWCINLLKEIRVKISECEERIGTHHGRVSCRKDLQSDKRKGEEENSNTYVGKVKSSKKVRGVGCPPEKSKVSTVEKIVEKVKKKGRIEKKKEQWEKVKEKRKENKDQSKAIYSYSSGISPFIYHQHGGPMSKIPNGELLKQVSQIQPWSFNQFYSQGHLAGQLYLSPHSNFMSSSRTSELGSNFTPSVERGEGGSRRD